MKKKKKEKEYYFLFLSETCLDMYTHKKSLPATLWHRCLKAIFLLLFHKSQKLHKSVSGYTSFLKFLAGSIKKIKKKELFVFTISVGSVMPSSTV